MIYLDSAATTLLKPAAVAKACKTAVKKLASPGRGGHRAAMLAADTAYECRLEAARLFNVAEAENIVFTSNATHALNIAIKSLISQGDKVVISGYEHNAVVRPLHAIGARVGIARSALFEPEMMALAFERSLTSDTKACVCTHVSNVFGYELPIGQIARMCAERGIPLIIDASQSAGCLKLDFERLRAAFIAMPGHKGLYGPQGTGLLLCGAETKPIIEGGTGSLSQEEDMPDFLPDRLEAGTHNMVGIAGLLEGLKFVNRVGADAVLRHEKSLIELAAGELCGVAGIRAYHAEHGFSQTNVMSLTVRDVDCERVAQLLSDRGIAVRAGMHCAPLAHRTADTIDGGTVRLSVCAFNTRRDIKRAAAEIIRISRAE